MPLADLLTAERIVMMTEPGDRDQVLDAAARLLAASSPTMTPVIGAALRERESVGSTGIGHGVAIPHARSNAHDAARGAFLRLERAVEFGARDQVPVDLVFAMSVPSHSPQQHLEILSELAERFSSAEFRDALRGAADVQALRRVLLDLPRATMTLREAS
ncbi:MAG TPA: PTS sugar transporter subunit IIA [Luteimonas sp.]|nr:PTS sugar transporter subunit IIA [Luteimonas sp.]